MPECIHGLEIPRCDICYPKAQPAAPVPVRTVRTPRSTRIAGISTIRKSIDPTKQRVYHVTHIDNLESILDADRVSADATPVVDLSTTLTRELRQTAEVAPGLPVSEHVPFYLAPTALRWEELRSGAEDETRWSPAARAAASVDFVVLVTTVSALGPDAVVADGDAAASLTRFATGEQIIAALTRLHDTESFDAGEVLARESVPFGAIQLIGVANDRVRDRVREQTSTKVAVYPPWFVAGL